MVVMQSPDPSPATAAAGENAADEIWSTFEDLLLACAVNRHGSQNWDSVASEIRSRFPHLLTADHCRHRYLHLRRRFNADADEESTVQIPWLDELRNLRVAELRQEVQRYDVSIGSLQLKVKKLEEERERSLQEEEPEAVNGSGSGSDPDPKGPDDHRQDPVAAADSGLSCKESNSTEPKVEIKLDEDHKTDPDRVGNRSGSDPTAAAAGEVSYNGSSETIARGAVRSPAGEVNPILNESGESVAESKESSDVQSSASLSRRRRRGRRRRAAVGESEVEPILTVRKAVDVESQPLIAFLEIIRSNKNGSVFDRRLESQESARYRSLIRCHVDFEMVRNRVGRNGYRSSEFFRDLLLLCNNALVFYPPNSPESIAAVHLRDLINKEIAATFRKTPQTSPPSPKEPTSPSPPQHQPALPPPAQQPLPPPKVKSDPDRVDKPAPLPPLVACRKRSSITSKPAKKVKEEKVETKQKEKEEEVEDEDEDEEEPEVKGKEKPKVADKKSTKQRTAMSRGLRTNKTRGSKNPKPDPIEEEPRSPKSPKSPPPPPTNTISTAKKKGAASFLNRMKKSSPNGTLLETLKGSGSSSKNSKKVAVKEESKKEKEKEKESASKRNVGRPPKRAAAAPPAKRAREEKAAPLARKRGRR